jgi:hypothetical protein
MACDEVEGSCSIQVLFAFHLTRHRRPEALTVCRGGARRRTAVTKISWDRGPSSQGVSVRP